MTKQDYCGPSLGRSVSTDCRNGGWIFLALVLILMAAAPAALADAQQIDDYRWTGVERVVAIGDLHGDYGNYLLTLKAAGLIDERRRWSGGKTHLVQTGDIPDRGPDTLKIIAHMKKLAKQAKRSGGRVHNLMGNHEAMNAYGDLRYVSAGEFEAFVDKHSEAVRDRHFENLLAKIEAGDPSAFANLPVDFREQWNASHPLGWVEHQQAWNPKSNPDAEYFQWVMDTRVAVQINDLIFLHGGISSRYCRNSLASLTAQAQSALLQDNPRENSILTDAQGPLWYRGLSGGEPEASIATVEAILADKGARHIVVGHTGTGGAIWPSYSGRVIQIDTGISAVYGGHVGYLEVDAGRLFAGYPGGRIELPEDDSGRLAYLSDVVALLPENERLQKQLATLRDAGAESGSAPTEAPASGSASASTSAEPSASVCGISH